MKECSGVAGKDVRRGEVYKGEKADKHGDCSWREGVADRETESNTVDGSGEVSIMRPKQAVVLLRMVCMGLWWWRRRASFLRCFFDGSMGQ